MFASVQQRHTDGTDTAVPRWVGILAPSAILAVVSIAFSVGLYVGRSETAVELTRLSQQISNHTESPRHRGAVGADVLELRFSEVYRRLDAIESHLERLDGR